MKESFFEDVFEVVKLIPVGRVCSYSLIGEYLGDKRAARMVGWAMNTCHLRPDIPAHRVVNKNGILTGKNHFGGNIMQERLENEGITVINNQIQNFETILWNPNLELL